MLTVSLRQRKSSQIGSPQVTDCKYGQDMLSGISPMLLPELKTAVSNQTDHEVRYTYDVVYRRKKSMAIRTTFDDLQKSTTILEVNILISSFIITVLLAAVIQILRITLKRVVDNAPVNLK